MNPFNRREPYRVILISGPAGSGKTSLAERIAQNKGWSLLSEDDYWGEIKKGRPSGEGRTPEEQGIIQPAVLAEIHKLFARGDNVVLEFINYENPPRPLIYYHEELQKSPCEILVRVLRPTESAIMDRKKKRGRDNRRPYERELKHTRDQLACLDADYIRDEWVIDNSALSVEETYIRYFSEFIEERKILATR